MKKALSLFALAAMLVSYVAADPQGEAVAKAHYDLKGIDDQTAVATMVLIDASGNKRSRSLEMYTLVKDNTNSAFVKFLSPADVAGTKFLTVSVKGGESDQRLYLPATKKVRKIASSAKNGDFMGSDLSYYDMEAHNFEDYTYTFLATDQTLTDPAFKGMLFDKIESKPKDSSAPYSKSIQWINKADHVVYQLQAFDEAGQLYKTIQFVKVEVFGGVAIPTQTLVINHKRNTKTLLQLSSVKVNTGIKADVFSPQNLER